MHHLLKTALGAAILVAAYYGTFGLPIGGSALSAGNPESSFSAGGSGRTGPGGRRAPGGPASVPVEAVVSAPFPEVVTAIGTSRARHSIDVTSEAAGRVVEINLVANEHVAEGDVLLRLASQVEEIELRVAELELESARQTLERYRMLNSSGSGTVAGTTVQEAEMAVMLAEATWEKARHTLDQFTIEAPISGRLGLSDARAGGMLSAGDLIVTIDDTSRIILSFELPERVIELLEVGREIRATTPALAGRSFMAVITAFDSRIDETTRTVKVEAEIDNVDGGLWPGMSFAVRLSNESPPLPQIPLSALSWTNEGARVWAVRNGVATAVPVGVRMRQGDRAWVEGDLSPGDHVVLDGSARIREGAAIAFESDPPESNGGHAVGPSSGEADTRVGAAENAAPATEGRRARAGEAG